MDITFTISKEVFKIVGCTYVDDCDLIQSGSNSLTILESIQDLIDSWGSLMEVFVGVISPEKSWWCLIEYIWHRVK